MQIQLISEDTGNKENFLKLDNCPIFVCGSQRRGQKTVLDGQSHLEILLHSRNHHICSPPTHINLIMKKTRTLNSKAYLDHLELKAPLTKSWFCISEAPLSQN